jgi:DNA helicase II / ATP-dependent DNA helicase PcrA
MTDSPPIQLRPSQADILRYEGGRMAVSAVPGSGKTFTLALLTAQLIADGRIQPEQNQQILIVTYLNASVDNFRARVRSQLERDGLPPVGFDVRTLHSLSLEIVRAAGGGELDAPAVLDETLSANFLTQAVDSWIDQHSQLWHEFLPDNSPQMRARWRQITESMARSFMRTAKNQRWKPDEILARFSPHPSPPPEGEGANPPLPPGEGRGEGFTENATPLVYMLAGIYQQYQYRLNRQQTLDFDDLIWQAADLVASRPDLAATLRQRWPYVLEDEAQDSVPLQELLLNALTGEQGNWVRVGDPNQAITSTFTAAHPRFFNAFIDRPDVVSRPLPNSGRCAKLILGAANRIVHWVCDKHPVPEARKHAFRRQDILPTPPGDAQPNPPDEEAAIRIKVYRHREDEELPAVAQLAHKYSQARPDQTIAILVPTNSVGYKLVEQLDELDANYDNLLRGGSREREIAAALHAMLAVLSDPLDRRALNAAYAALSELGHPAAAAPEERRERLTALLRSLVAPESLLFPQEARPLTAALPANIADAEDIGYLTTFADFMRRLFRLRPLPIDDLTLALADELFAHSFHSEAGDAHFYELDLAIAYQIANILRQWRDAQPDWRLPELAAQLADVASGRRHLPITTASDLGYEPQPGRISLATQHSAKGLEWDAVFLVGVDGFWVPGSLDAPFIGVHDFLGGDPTAEANAQLIQLMTGQSDLYPGRTATESAHIEIICERLRLLYVGVTRARLYLHLSRSRTTRSFNRDQEAEPATVLGVLYDYLKGRK